MPDYREIILNQALKPQKIKRASKTIDVTRMPSNLFCVKQKSTTQTGKTVTKTFIYKPSDHHTAYKNWLLSQNLSLLYDIPVPDSKVFVGGGVYFEKYQMIPGTPLSTYLKNNKKCSEQQIEFILYEVLTLDKQISEIPITDEKLKQELMLTHPYYRIKNFTELVAQIYKKLPYDDIALHHADLNPSNILLDKNGEVCALLDLDGFALCSTPTALAQILISWSDISTNRLIEIYQSVHEPTK